LTGDFRVSDTEAVVAETDDKTEFDNAFKSITRKKLGLPEKAPETEGEVDEPEADKEGLSDTAPPQDVAAETPAAEETNDDIWAGADPRLREAIEVERKAREKAENFARTQTGRLSQANQRIAEFQAKYEKVQGKSEAASTEAEVAKAEDDLAKLREDYPDFAKLVEKVETADSRLKKLDEVEQERESERVKALLLGNQEKLAEAHPDWAEVREGGSRSAEFVDWYHRQPAYVQAAIQTNAANIVDPDTVADILTRFKAETAPAQEEPEPTPDTSLAARRERQLEASRGVKANAPVITGQTPASDFESEFKRQVAARKKAANR
jgi:hypothetical protein